jgi:hypothetical protein
MSDNLFGSYFFVVQRATIIAATHFEKENSLCQVGAYENVDLILVSAHDEALDIVQQLSAASNSKRIIIISDSDEPDCIAAGIRQGARGYIPTNMRVILHGRHRYRPHGHRDAGEGRISNHGGDTSQCGIQELADHCAHRECHERRPGKLPQGRGSDALAKPVIAEQLLSGLRIWCTVRRA